MTNRGVITTVILLALLTACTAANDRERETPGDRAATTFRLGLAAYERDEYRAAYGFFSESLADYRSIDNIEGMLRSLVNRAEAALALYRQDLATESLAEARRLLRYDRAPGFDDRIRYLEARIATREGDHERATRQLDNLTRDQSAPASLRAAASLQRARIAVETADADAPQLIQKARETLADRPAYEPSLALLEADYLSANGSDEAALEAYAEALQGFRRHQNRLGIAATYESWGRLLLTQRAWDDAHDRLDRALTLRLWMTDRARSIANLDELITIAKEQKAEERLNKLVRWRTVLEDDDDLRTTSGDTWAEKLP